MTTATTIAAPHRGPIPAGEARRIVASGAISVFGSLPSLASTHVLDAPALFIIGPLGLIIAAGVVAMSARQARVPADWLDGGVPALRILGAVALVAGVVVFLVGLFTSPEWALAYWLFVPASAGIGVWLFMAGASRLRPDVAPADDVPAR
ncbi:hypothetical protein [Plantibacter cousiniae (nom. nud.)]|uniref:hypothetical protein n=1 Tax=Plantibacter cousiniae (nom. nud.) TaxID=199709 RepID=UPI001DBD074E|nr:hypothetical protein [Plantibacter cousiniae]CAH0207842.1 hypothetical protein SRABI02_02124 [Plantibacter cousiniae]